MQTKSTSHRTDKAKLIGDTKNKRKPSSSKTVFKKFLPFRVTNVNPQNPEEFVGLEKVRKDELIWHVKDRSVPRSKMDLDFKLVAAYHCLKKAQQAHKRYLAAEEDIKYFMNMFEEFEENIGEVYDIQLPNDLEGINQLRDHIQQMQTYIEDYVI